ncbi:hypothetical protein ACWGLE_18530 [Streptomyces sp. NPDC055897]
MTNRMDRERGSSRPINSPSIIPDRGTGETSGVVFDARLCGSLLIAVLLCIVIIIVPVAPELWPLAIPAVVPLLTAARRSTVRIHRS